MSQKKSSSSKQKKKQALSKKTYTPAGIAIALSFGVLAVFCALSLISPSLTGAFGNSLNKLLTGTFGICSVLVPVYLMLLAIFWNKYITEGSILIIKTVCSAFTMVFLPAFFSSIMLGTSTAFSLTQLYSKGTEYIGGGFVGGVVSQFLGKYINIFSPFLTLSIAIILILLTFGVTPSKALIFSSDLLIRLKNEIFEKIEDSKQKRIERAKEEDLTTPFDDPDDIEEAKPKKKKKNEPEEFEEEVKLKKRSKPVFTKEEIDAETELHREMSRSSKHSTDNSVNNKVYDYNDKSKTKASNTAQAQADNDISKIINTILDKPVDSSTMSDVGENDDSDDLPFDIDDGNNEPIGTQQKLNDDELNYTVENIGDISIDPEKPAYQFPPISLLKTEVDEMRDVSEELEANAEKLTQLLDDFNVRAEVTHISYGPTITRYEVKPAPGVRVSSISKLVDDISMSFGTMGVRIEAPIPGKEAVGIEVPNRDVSTVRLRSLIEADKFKNADSRLFCALGKDVVGDPVYLDIAKMPHLLIAGATGMGKSVCINSLITSILYKATPDEVKLILIDPKKVEFVPYANLPHLLTPVVSDPKKAAGALHWAVSEMERRYDLIERVGVRNIFGYNEVTASDPEMERLPQVVIIIDELADLMMTAKQDVEASIARLAQKARAAGMHLILGTQRPSVSVVTGLIKANVPSRIACKMASQVDSRTVLDIAGAEKLIGRGDMLYAPVGIAKPLRLQGAFVSDSEVEAVTSFIRKSIGKEPEYAKDIIERIEKEAKNLDNKHTSDDDFDVDGDQDELLLPAIEFAFEQGKVSTSLFQRKLSIGYGRAAKIIDCMQAMGICSAAEGNKPRTLTMTREEYYERYGQ